MYRLSCYRGKKCSINYYGRTEHFLTYSLQTQTSRDFKVFIALCARSVSEKTKCYNKSENLRTICEFGFDFMT